MYSQAPPQAPPPASCHSKVELRVSCTGLLDKDTFSKSDPICVLFEQKQNRWCEVNSLIKLK